MDDTPTIEYKGILTEAGRKLCARAAAFNLPVSIEMMALGDGDGEIPIPLGGEEELVHEVYRAPLDDRILDPENPNIATCIMVLGQNTGGFTIREYGLLAKDIDDQGNVLDNYVMVIYGNHPEQYKPEPDEFKCTFNMNVKIVMSEVSNITVNVLEEGYTLKRDFNAEIATLRDEAEANKGWLPAGMIMAYGGRVAPNGWLMCNGQAVSRTTYSALFTAIGTSYGAGDGQNTFNLPDLRARFLEGSGRADYAPGEYLAAGLPSISHSHTASSALAGGHQHTATTASNGGHTHTATTSNAGAHTHTANSAGAHTHTVYGVQAAGANTSPIKLVLQNDANLVIYPKDGTAQTALWSSGTRGRASENFTRFTSIGIDGTSSSSGAHTHTTTSAGAHTHTLTTNNQGAHTHTLTTNNTGGHSHTISIGTFANSGVYGKSNTVQPPACTANYVIKY